MNRIPSQSNSDDSANKISLAGYLLVAAPCIQDPVFAKSVCMIVEHSDEHTIGIMLNRPLAIDTEPLWTQLLEGATKPTNALAHVNFGGPQSGPVLAIHDSEQLAEGGNDQGVYLSAQAETLKKIALSAPNHCRLFVGHAVWQPSQLEREIVEGHWHVLPASPEMVFADEETMWTRGIHTVGSDILKEATGLASLMQHPGLN